MVKLFLEVSNFYEFVFVELSSFSVVWSACGNKSPQGLSIAITFVSESCPCSL